MNTQYARRVPLMLLMLLASCSAPPPLLEVPAGAPPDFPFERYRQPSAEATVYTVDSARSLIWVYAYRDGALKRMGHDHVIASRDLAGFVRRDSAGAASVVFAGDLYLPLAAMTVDEPLLRVEAGFDTEPSAEDRAGTQGNMLKSLEAADYPFVSATLGTPEINPVTLASEQGITTNLELTLKLHGSAHSLSVPVVATLEAGTLRARGKFVLRQTDFGIEPFNVLGGALAVKDEVEVQFDLYADVVVGDSD